MKRSLLNAFLILAVAAFAVLSSAADKPATQPGPGLQYLTPEQTDVLRQALNLPPGTLVEVEFQSKDGGTLKVTQEATGRVQRDRRGRQALRELHRLAPTASLDDTGDAKGGDAKAKQSASAPADPASSVGEPAFLVWRRVPRRRAGFCVYARLRRAPSSAAWAEWDSSPRRSTRPCCCGALPPSRPSPRRPPEGRARGGRA